MNADGGGHGDGGGHADGSDHVHGGGGNGDAARESTRTLGAVAAINLVGFAVELAGGLLFGSVALIGDALHMLFDALAYAVALGATLVARRADPGGRWSYGLHRVEPLAAFLNGVLLVPMVGYLLWESFRRFGSAVAVDAGTTLVLALGGLVINLASVSVLGGGEMSLNERGAYYHLLGDAGGSLAVVAAMVAILTTGATVVDPIAAIVVAGLIVRSAWDLVAESGRVFLQASPVDPDAVRADLETLPGVASVEDCHAWALSSRVTVATVYLVDEADTVAERDALVERVHDRLAGEFEVTHATVEAVSERHDHGLAGPRE